jgi:hypothetical protein
MEEKYEREFYPTYFLLVTGFSLLLRCFQVLLTTKHKAGRVICGRSEFITESALK